MVHAPHSSSLALGLLSLGLLPALALPAALAGCPQRPAQQDVPVEGSRSRRCPPEMVLVEPSTDAGVERPFCVDRWEGSLVELTATGETAFSPYDRVAPTGKEPHRVRAVSRPGVVPQGYISKREARAACEASAKRLCAEAEWVRACKGEHVTVFPYGAERVAGYCNDAGISPLHVFYPEAPSTYTMEKMNEPRLNQLTSTVAPTGAFTHCVSSYGAFDMVGNLHEWVEAPTATMRGGYYQDTRIDGNGCDYQNVAHGAFYHDYSTGFRCCADAR